MGDKEPPLGFHHLSWKFICHNMYQLCEIHASAYILMRDQLFFFFFSFYPNIDWFATTLQAITTSQA